MKTKKSFLLAVALLPQLGLLASPATEGDTLVVEKPNKVTIVTTDSLQRVLVEGRQDDPTYSYTNTLQIVDSNFVSSTSINKEDFTLGFSWPKFAKRALKDQPTYQLTAHLAIGFVNAPGMPAPADVDMGNSGEVWFFFDNEIRPWKNNHIFSFGLGIDWRNYRMSDNYRFVKTADAMNAVEPLPEGASPKFSRIKVFSLNFPIRYQYQSHNWGFSLGPVINFNTSSSIKTKYKLNGDKHKEKENNIHPQFLTVDFMGTIDTPMMTFYVKYSPCNVLQSDYGLKFKSLSIGCFF